MLRRLALAGLIALAPALAAAQFATIGPTPPASDNSHRLATTEWANNFFSALPLAQGKIFIGSAGNVATPQTPSGDCTLSNSGVITCPRTNPTSQKFLSGSGTYATPAGAKSIKIRMRGGGSGGASGNGTGSSAAGNTCWNTTGAACTTPVYQAGGAAGASAASTSAQGAAGGTVSGSGTCNIAIAGGDGDSGTISISGSQAAKGGRGGGDGGGSAGLNSSAGTAAKANSGSGGGGGGESSAATAGGGPGGAAGAFCEARINTPAATYTYAVGAKSAGSTAPGTGGQNGGDGGDGGIWVEETY